ncbi:MAG: TetR/AcrR family transcriptional regulator [Rhodospirillaceae bacterium]|nr:TetR/AcrR family transcriptional regulator [Rhodospirillaceae bacterium]
MTRRDDSKTETRKLILNTARRLFWEKGADTCTIRDIAKEAGVSPASVIVHFKNKTALLEAALHEDIGTALSEAMATMPEDKGLNPVLMHMASAMLCQYDKNRKLYRILVRDTFFTPDHENPTMTKLLEDQIEFIITLIEQEKINNAVRKDADATLAATSFFYLYIGVLRDFLRDPELSVEKAVAILSATLTQHLRGIEIA